VVIEGHEATELPDRVQPENEHRPAKLPNGAIICLGCGLTVPQPSGMPNYDGAAMGDW
jgi:hypothetical protein